MRVASKPTASGARPGTLFRDRGISDHPVHFFGVVGLLQGLPKLLFVQKLRDVGESVQVLLKLALRNEEQHHEIDRLIVEGIEVHALPGTSECANYLVDEVR